jgi:hypothetical protein
VGSNPTLSASKTLSNISNKLVNPVWIISRAFKRGEAPLSSISPLPFQGKGDGLYNIKIKWVELISNLLLC